MTGVYVYAVSYDLGFAPNPFGGVCSLACCKPNIRRRAELGDWIIGLTGTKLKPAMRCLFGMLVTSDMTFDDYWAHPDFSTRRPKRNGTKKKLVGDNIYHRPTTEASWIQENSVHSSEDGSQCPLNTAHDTRINRVLLSDRFIYFGTSAPQVPPAILEKLSYKKNARDYRRFEGDVGRALIDWLEPQLAARPDYDAFVREAEQYAGKAASERLAISTLGLVGEIGSLISAVKKQMLGELPWDEPNAEIREELGDIMWYAFSVAQIVNTSPVNIFTINVAYLKREMAGTGEHDRKVQAALDGRNREQFLEAVKEFPRTAEMHFRDYQKLAYLTARTDGDVLMKVCLAALWQLAAEIMRHYLPESERELNQSIPDRPLNDILGDVAWHLSALASLVGLDLDEVAEANVRKVSFRRNRRDRTPLHDAGEPEQQQFPRRFTIVFVTVGPGRSRMYWNGRRLGDDLTDNAHDEDGYRFHDVMHLANVAHLGWSPVLRKMMDRRRRDSPETNEVEDGARAQIVEELIVKAIHTEGERLARIRHPGVPDGDLRLFGDRADISFRFLQTLRNYGDGLEVSDNRFWEWEDAISSGSALYDQLKRDRQGAVTVDLEARTLTYSPTVNLEVEGRLVGLAAAIIPSGADEGLTADVLRRTALKALRLEGSLVHFGEIDVDVATADRPHLRVRDDVERALWARGGILLRANLSDDGGRRICTVAALGDANIK